ncbi:NifB/NifX family molybdenum-iron cluster-binding protein [Endozoicomonas ascidiicola]|uniref:NifB/NifX family molybdenum-iron cluster-binding protein n=1 Tax=Endozoicomonas ascidiicola TaxID=1698521 RepID=UPI00082A3E66
MALAIAVTPNHQISGHFKQSTGFMVYNDDGHLITELAVTALKPRGCHLQKALQAQLTELNVDSVVLGKIGRRSLQRFLGACRT